MPDAPPTTTGVVAVVAGDGNRALRELGATRIVEGGQTMNPSAAELVEASIEHAAEVVVLPNNSNVILSAEQAAGGRASR